MKGVRAKDLRGNDPVELRSTVRKLEEDLFKHRLKKNTNQLENTMLIRSGGTGGAEAAPVSGSGEEPPAPSKTKTKRTSKKSETKERET